MAEIAGAVVIVTGADTPEGCAQARAVSASGVRTVVLCGRDGAAMGSLVRELAESGNRVAVFVGDPESEANELTEMVQELFVAREQANSPGSRSEAGR